MHASLPKDSHGLLCVVGNGPVLTFVDPIELKLFYSSEFFDSSRCRAIPLSGKPEVILATLRSPDFRFALIDPVPPSTRDSSSSWSHLERFLGQHHTRQARCVFGIAHISPNSSFVSDHILTGTFGGSRLELWDLEDPKGRLKGVFEGVTTDIWCIEYAHLWNDAVFSCGFGGEKSHGIRQHCATRLGAPVAIYANHSSQVTAVKVLEESHILLSASDDKRVNIWDVRTAHRSGCLDPGPSSRLGIFCLEVSEENDHMVMIGQREGVISLLDRRKADTDSAHVDSLHMVREKIVWEFARFESPVFGPCHAAVADTRIAIVTGFPSSQLKIAKVSAAGVAHRVPRMYSICAYGLDSANSQRLAEEDIERLGFLVEYLGKYPFCAVRLDVVGVDSFLICHALVTGRNEKTV